jgi:hypothetical protein
MSPASTQSQTLRLERIIKTAPATNNAPPPTSTQGTPDRGSSYPNTATVGVAVRVSSPSTGAVSDTGASVGVDVFAGSDVTVSVGAALVAVPVGVSFAPSDPFPAIGAVPSLDGVVESGVPVGVAVDPETPVDVTVG